MAPGTFVGEFIIISQQVMGQPQTGISNLVLLKRSQIMWYFIRPHPIQFHIQRKLRLFVWPYKYFGCICYLKRL